MNIRDGKVFLRKHCRDHGEFEALVYGDAQMYLDSTRFNKPGLLPLQFQTDIVDGCPSDCGLCPQHQQHACLSFIEVNTHCNLDCPICFPIPATRPMATQSPSSSASGCWTPSSPQRANRKY